MSDRPRITVALPTMNGSRHLAATLRSVLDQGGAAFDLLVSDDRSDDDTPQVARETAGDRAHVVVNSERLGLAGNWNRCVARSATAYTAIVHQDDLLRPGHLAAHVAAFRDDPALALVASASGVVDDEGADVPPAVVDRGGLGPVDRTFAPGEAVPWLVEANPFRCSAVSLRNAAHAELRGFDPAFRYVVDWDFWARVARAYSVRWLAATTVDVRWHPGSETHRFKHGTADLEESEALAESLLIGLGPGASAAAARSATRRRLSRAYLNRAHVALRDRDGPLGRRCLGRSVGLWPGVVGTILADPRLSAQMAALWVTPGLSVRVFGRGATGLVEGRRIRG